MAPNTVVSMGTVHGVLPEVVCLSIFRYVSTQPSYLSLSEISSYFWTDSFWLCGQNVLFNSWRLKFITHWAAISKTGFYRYRISLMWFLEQFNGAFNLKSALLIPNNFDLLRSNTSLTSRCVIGYELQWSNTFFEEETCLWNWSSKSLFT